MLTIVEYISTNKRCKTPSLYAQYLPVYDKREARGSDGCVLGENFPYLLQDLAADHASGRELCLFKK